MKWDSDINYREVITLRPRQNGRHFPDDIFKCIFVNENVWIACKISLRFVPKGPINNIPVLVQIMALRRPGDKPLSEPMLITLPTYLCVTRPKWVILNNRDKSTAQIHYIITIKKKNKTAYIFHCIYCTSFVVMYFYGAPSSLYPVLILW